MVREDVDGARVYLDAFKGMYLIEEVPGWVPPARDRKRFATKSKRYLAGPRPRRRAPT